MEYYPAVKNKDTKKIKIERIKNHKRLDVEYSSGLDMFPSMSEMVFNSKHQ